MTQVSRRLRGFLRRPTPEQLQTIGRREFLALTDAEAVEYARIADTMLDAFDRLDELVVTEAPPPARHFVPAAQPDADEDEVNAFLRTCLVRTGEEGPLAKLRVGVKDTIAVAGIPLTNGSRTASYTPTRDAIVVERLLAAGADIVGVLNMDDWSSGGTGETSVYGPPLNPIDPTRSAGGSSGGAGAAVGAGLVDLALGVDQAGSGRIPASYCGVVSLKPTHGLLPSQGITHIAHSIDTVSPTARTVELVARSTDALAGFDDRDPQSEYPHQVPRLGAALGTGVAGMRVGVIAESLEDPYCSADVRAGVLRAADVLAREGAVVEQATCPVWEPSWPVAVASLCQLGWATLQSDGQGIGHLGDVDPDRVRAFAMTRRLEADSFPPFLKAWMLLGRYLHEEYLSVYAARAQNARKHVRRVVTGLFDHYDLLLSPTTPTTAPLLELETRGEFEVLNRGLNGVDTAIFNLSGHPAIAVPSGTATDGMPTSVQIAGGHFRDGDVIRAAEVLEAGISR